MGHLRTFVTMISLSAGLVASGVEVTSYIHPPSEPSGLYVVDFNYGGVGYTYRIYCPSAEVRDITGGHWGKSRKAYQEDSIYFEGARVVRVAYEQVCY
jgi:hypothetical protein